MPHSKPLTLESTREHPYASGSLRSPLPDGGPQERRRVQHGPGVGTECDRLALALVQQGKLIVDPEFGTIYRDSGRRAERLCDGYGTVEVTSHRSQRRYALAHRVIWTFVHGLIPEGLQVNHRNQLRWDNRLANLKLVTATGNVNHARGHRYENADGVTRFVAT